MATTETTTANGGTGGVSEKVSYENVKDLNGTESTGETSTLDMNLFSNGVPTAATPIESIANKEVESQLNQFAKSEAIKEAHDADTELKALAQNLGVDVDSSHTGTMTKFQQSLWGSSSNVNVQSGRNSTTFQELISQSNGQSGISSSQVGQFSQVQNTLAQLEKSEESKKQSELQSFAMSLFGVNPEGTAKVEPFSPSPSAIESLFGDFGLNKGSGIQTQTESNIPLPPSIQISETPLHVPGESPDISPSSATTEATKIQITVTENVITLDGYGLQGLLGQGAVPQISGQDQTTISGVPGLFRFDQSLNQAQNSNYQQQSQSSQSQSYAQYGNSNQLSGSVSEHLQTESSTITSTIIPYLPQFDIVTQPSPQQAEELTTTNSSIPSIPTGSLPLETTPSNIAPSEFNTPQQVFETPSESTPSQQATTISYLPYLLDKSTESLASNPPTETTPPNEFKAPSEFITSALPASTFESTLSPEANSGTDIPSSIITTGSAFVAETSSSNNDLSNSQFITPSSNIPSLETSSESTLPPGASAKPDGTDLTIEAINNAPDQISTNVNALNDGRKRGRKRKNGRNNRRQKVKSEGGVEKEEDAKVDGVESWEWEKGRDDVTTPKLDNQSLNGNKEVGGQEKAVKALEKGREILGESSMKTKFSNNRFNGKGIKNWRQRTSQNGTSEASSENGELESQEDEGEEAPSDKIPHSHHHDHIDHISHSHHDHPSSSSSSSSEEDKGKGGVYHHTVYHDIPTVDVYPYHHHDRHSTRLHNLKSSLSLGPNNSIKNESLSVSYILTKTSLTGDRQNATSMEDRLGLMGEFLKKTLVPMLREKEEALKNSNSTTPTIKPANATG